MPDLAKQKWRSRFEAWMLDAGAEDSNDALGRHKTATIGSMTGTVVEFGPGTGANLRYYAPGVHVIAIEPNPHMHGRLRAAAAEHDVDVEIRTIHGESVDVEDASADGVVGTLLLCGVDDPATVVAEAHRVLKPGGTYFFVEHVEAPAGTKMHALQRLLRRPHGWLFNGCRTDQDTSRILGEGPFESLEIEPIDRGAAAVYVRHQIVGTAVKQR